MISIALSLMPFPMRSPLPQLLRVASHLSGDVLEDDSIEPPLPPNLDQLSLALEAFIELVELDVDCVAAAA